MRVQKGGRKSRICLALPHNNKNTIILILARRPFKLDCEEEKTLGLKNWTGAFTSILGSIWLKVKTLKMF